MIYKFKSKSSGDVIMTASSGDQLLRLLGREPSRQGIIEASAMPGAIAALERAVAEDESARAAAAAQRAARGEAPDATGEVTVRQRVWPLVEMMKRSQAEDADIVWGV